MKKLLLATLLALTSAHAEIRDPKGLLAQIDAYLGAPSFAQSFQVGDQAEFRRLSQNCEIDCADDGCWSVCEGIDQAMTLRVASVDASSAWLEFDDGNMKEITAATFGAMKGNLVRDEALRFFTQTALPGYLEAIELKDRQVKLASGEMLAGKEIVFDYHVMPWDHTFKVRYTVSPRFSGVGQIIQMAAFGEWYYRLSGANR